MLQNKLTTVVVDQYCDYTRTSAYVQTEFRAIPWSETVFDSARFIMPEKHTKNPVKSDRGGTKAAYVMTGCNRWQADTSSAAQSAGDSQRTAEHDVMKTAR